MRSFADTTCQPIYGGGQTCITTGNISINKAVINPQTNQFVDNLSINDPRFQPGFITTFQLKIVNTGNSNISKVKITDIFPQYVTFSSGPGSFDNNTKTLTFEIDNLKSNEARTFTITGKIVDSSSIPIDQGGVVCVINQAQAVNLDYGSQVSQDNAQLCIEKVAVSSGFPSVAAVAVTPSTGPEAWGLISLIPTGIAGWFLRRRSFKKLVRGGGEAT